MKELCQEIPGVSVEFQKDVPHLGAVKTGCQGICELGPLVRIEPLHYQYVKGKGRRLYGNLPADRAEP